MELALMGGFKVREEAFPDWPVFNSAEIEGVVDVIRSRKWCRLGGEKVSEFEKAFADFHDAKYAVCVSNGTVALEIALRCLGVKPGDEVIVPPISFITSATSPLLAARAVPVFADVDKDTCCISAESIEERITERTKAILVVHFGGYPVDLDGVLAVARRHKIPVLEDAAHAHGTEWKGRKVGAIGTVGAFSFQQSKTMTSGEGGIVITHDDRIAELAESYQHVGRVKDHPFYEHHRLAGNARLTELQGALLLAQLEKLKEHLEIRERNAAYLTERLREIEGLYPVPLERDPRVTRRNYFFYLFGYRSEAFAGVEKGTFLRALQAEGIPCDAGIPLLYRNPLFEEKRFFEGDCPFECKAYEPELDYSKTHCPNAELRCEENVRITHRVLLGRESDIDDVVTALGKIRENAHKLARMSA